MQGFKPFGIPRRELETIVMSIDEYEAIRLLDYEGLTQEQAAEKMNVSRPTLTRIYENARRSMARTLVEGTMMVIEGGNVEFDHDWYRFRRCHKLIGGLNKHVKCRQCDGSANEELTPIYKLKP
jgi:predicted DNA-binding protein (UPF0251 family)